MHTSCQISPLEHLSRRISFPHGRTPAQKEVSARECSRRHTSTQCSATERSSGSEQSASATRRALLAAGLVVPALASVPAAEGAEDFSDWEQVPLPIDPSVVLYDVGFTDAKHGFLLGSRETLLETRDGGKTWAPRSIEAARDEGFNYRFTSISFSGSEGWIIGKPAILLHTTDGGTNWDRVPLSAKLPGNPLLITALPGKGQAEMTTDQGAVYVTDNAAYTWTAAVQETVDATLNRTVSSDLIIQTSASMKRVVWEFIVPVPFHGIALQAHSSEYGGVKTLRGVGFTLSIGGASYYEGTFSQIARSPGGEYVAVSSRGNFYLTWAPGETYWSPHNRPTARRVQNMGWSPENKLWLSTRGGDVFFSPTTGVSERFDQAKLGARGFGILDVGFVPESNVGFAAGGSGTLLKTLDGGKTWKRDRSTDNVAGNLYAVKFVAPNTGFILGNNAILLKYA